MGIFKNIKNLFVEEEQEEIKQQTITEKEKINDKKIKEAVTERDLFQTEPTFKFPVIFDNEEIDIEDKKEYKPLIKTPEIKIEPKKEFKVSPIISPVYGILEKNYQKEVIKPRDGLLEKEEKTFDLDSVRKRAFGETITREEKYSYKKEEEIKTEKKEEKEESKDKEIFDEKKVEELDKKIKTIDELLKESNDDFYSLVDSMYEGDDEE